MLFFVFCLKFSTILIDREWLWMFFFFLNNWNVRFKNCFWKFHRHGTVCEVQYEWTKSTKVVKTRITKQICKTHAVTLTRAAGHEETWQIRPEVILSHTRNLQESAGGWWRFVAVQGLRNPSRYRAATGRHTDDCLKTMTIWENPSLWLLLLIL